MNTVAREQPAGPAHDAAGGVPAHAEPANLGVPPQEPAARSVPLLVLATLAVMFTLRWAEAVFIPVLMGLLFSYALSPVVDWLQKCRIPRVISSACLVVGILVLAGTAAYSLSDEAAHLIESLPDAAQKLQETIRAQGGSSGKTLATVQKAAARLEQAAEDPNGGVPVGRGVQRVQIEKPKLDIRNFLWSGTVGMLGMLTQTAMVALIAFFLMTSGDRFRRKVVHLAGPTLTARKITLNALNEINDQIQRYMLVQLFTSCVVGVATWLCFLAIGLEHAAVWGIVAGLLDLVPYIGSMVVGGLSALVGFLQFGTLEMAALIGGSSLAIHAIEAFLLTPWLTSRANRMNPVVIFVGVLLWGWLWGIWGLLLAVPILVVIKSVCERVEGLQGVHELLSA